MYVGVHSTYNLEDSYLGSGNAIKYAFKKYGKQNFKRQILHYCLTVDDMLEIEKHIVDKNFIIRKDTYNISLGGKYSPPQHTLETKQKMSDSMTGLNHIIKYRKPHSDKTKALMKANRRNNPKFGKLAHHIRKLQNNI
jgi:group I intron endonuclease